LENKIINLFKRTTSAKNFIPEIDGLRFIAIFTVLLFHFHFQLVKSIQDLTVYDFDDTGFWSSGWWFVRLDLGVKVFFGISGFILSIPFFNQYWFNGKKVDLKSYFVRRLTRLEPPFIIALTGFLIVHLFILKEKSFLELFPHYVASLFYLHTVIYDSYSTILPVTWSLETEVQFYLIIPFLAAWLLGSGFKLRALLVGIALLLASVFFRRYMLTDGIYGLSASLLAFFSYFLVGIGFAYVYLTRLYWLSIKNWFWDLMFLSAFVGLFVFYKPQSDPIGQVFFCLSMFILFIGVFKGRFSNWVMTRPVIYLIGGMCYTIYLIHLPYFGLWATLSAHIGILSSYSSTFWYQFVLAFIPLMLICGGFFLLIEKPCMQKDWHLKLLTKWNLKK
jgi:peptidoglycan/LPS O-acetylase OafA/YrhL